MASAQSAVQDAYADLEEDSIQKQIDELQDSLDELDDYYSSEIDALEEISEKWSKISSDADHYADVLVATGYLGEGWQDKVISGTDDDIYTVFKDLYDTNYQQALDLESQITTTNYIYDLLNEYVEAYRNETLTYEEAYASIESLLEQMNSDMSTTQNLENVLTYLSQVYDTEATVSSVLESMQTKLSETASEFLTNLEQYQENDTLINATKTSWEVLTDNVSEIRDYMEEAVEALEDIADLSWSYYDDDDDDDSSGSSSSSSSSSSHYSGVSASTSYGNSVSSDVHSVSSPGELYNDLDDDTYDTGLDKGVVGESTKNIADDVIVLGTKNLDSDEVPAVLHRGELVFNPDQQSTLLSNFEKVYNPLSSLGSTAPIFTGLDSSSSGVSITIGDIILPDVTDVDGFAKAMDKQFESAMRKAMSAKF